MHVTLALISLAIALCFLLSNRERELTEKYKQQRSGIEALKPPVGLESSLTPSDSFKPSGSDSESVEKQRRQLQEHKAQLTNLQKNADQLGEKVTAYRVALLFLVLAIFVLIIGLFTSALSRTLFSLSFPAILSAILLFFALLFLVFRPASISRKITYTFVGGTLLASILAGARALARVSFNPSINLEAKIDAAINGYFNGQSALGPEHIASINSFSSGRRCPTKEEKACDSVEVQDRLTPIFDRVCRSTTEHLGPPQWVVIIGSTDRVPLRGKARATFESNFGLARARAEWIKTKWLNWKKTAHSDQTTNCQIPDENFITIGAGPRATGELLAANTKGGYSLANDDDRGIDIWALWPSPGKTPDKALDISIKVNDIDLKKKFPLPKTQFGFGTKKQKQ